MKNNSKKIVLILLVLTFITIGSIAYARDGKKTVDIYYRNIKILVDGKPVAFNKDATGNQVEPFIYEGTTYLPVRAVGEALGMNVKWDGETSTVSLGEVAGSINYLTETLEPYNKKDIDIFKLDSPTKLHITGTEYKTGYKFKGYNSNMIFNLNGIYSEVRGTIGYSGKESHDEQKEFNVYLDGTLYKSIIVEAKELGKEIVIPVSGVNQIKFEAKPTYFSIGFGDVIIK